MLLFKIFIVFSKISLLAIGGAYSFLPLLERELVVNNSWLSKEEFLEVLGIVRMIPGAISLKFAAYTGYKMAKFAGSIAAIAGVVIVPVVLIFFLAKLYVKYKNLPEMRSAFELVQLAVFAMLLVMAFNLLGFDKLRSIQNIGVILIVIFLFGYLKLSPALIIITAGAIGIVTNLLLK